MKTYDSYKETGVEWIGEIPSHWDFGEMRYQLSNNDGGVWGKDVENENDGTVVIRSTEITIDGNWDLSNPVKRLLTNPEIEKNILFEGDIVLTKSSGSQDHIGKSVIVNSEVENLKCCYSNFVQRLRFKNYNPKLYHYILNNYIVREQYRYLTQSTTGLGNLNSTTLNEIKIPYIPLSEQQQIVSFLDTKTSLIDSFIEKTQQKIELLKESITSYVFYKTEKTFYNDYWFQKIPKGWKILKLREVFEDITDKNHTEERLLSAHQIKGVIYRDEQEQSVMDPSGDISNYKLIKEGDFVISLRSSEGGFEFSQVRGLVSPVYTVLRPKFEIDTILFKYLFKSENFIQEINRYVTGIREGKTINFKDIRDIPIPIPKRIDTSVILKHQKILELFHLLEKQNNKLKEYRQSIISEVVTGKKRVVS